MMSSAARVFCSVAALALVTAMPYDPSGFSIDRSIFRDQHSGFLSSPSLTSFDSGFVPSSFSNFFGSQNILTTPHVLRSSISAEFPLRTLARCPKGLARDAAGRCVEPIVRKNVFLFKSPQVKAPQLPPPVIPKPKILFNYVYVNSGNDVRKPNPIVVPPPQEKTLVYVLRKRPEPIRQEVIEVPPQPDSDPEVFFINYNEGQNQQLPGGVDLQTVLAQSAAQQTGGVEIGGSGLGLFVDGASTGLAGQLNQVGSLAGLEFDISREFQERNSFNGLGSYVPPSARTVQFTPSGSSQVQRLEPTIASEGSVVDSTSTLQDQEANASSNTEESEQKKSDEAEGNNENQEAEANSAVENSEKIQEKRSPRADARPTSTSTSLVVNKQVSLETPPSGAKSFVFSVMKKPATGEKEAVVADLDTSPSENNEAISRATDDVSATIPVLTSEDVKERLKTAAVN
ncbi:uncharacterized protein LOC108680898 isoform X2 [Hyalella azteca]|uniref:Uncharacterized protein LOC108680898 isoform X2 n=1 Tax=Hyalella azteca TaxID=294128 RepID=A0A8B7PJ03_HYAAZ|nr:uncharacterized protein LOC108680898 isoform X2 [Hyalella azteca]